MTDRELKKLSRAELLELLLEEGQENERLRAQLEKANQAINDKKIAIDNAGSIAEAALSLSGVFDAAQQKADQIMADTLARCRQLEATRGRNATI